MHWKRKWPPTPVFLPGESQGRGSLVGCRLWGRTESDTNEETWQQQQQQQEPLTNIARGGFHDCVRHLVVKENMASSSEKQPIYTLI